MALPTIAKRQFNTKYPEYFGGKEGITWTPFDVGAESILLQTLESLDPNKVKTKEQLSDMLRAIKQVLGSCVINHDISDIPFFVVEHLFAKIRVKSTGEKIEFTHTCQEQYNGETCNHVMDVSFNIDTLELQKDADIKTTFTIDEEHTITVIYPTIDTMIEMVENGHSENDIVAYCIDKVVVGEKVYDAQKESIEERMKFFHSLELPIKLDIMSNFINRIPKLHIKLDNLECPKCKTKKVFEINGMNELFT